MLHHKVGLVVDPHFGARLVTIARAFHVWAIDSPENTPIIEEIWSRDVASASSAEDPLERGVTSFVAEAHESRAEVCARIAPDLAEHHGEFARTPPWSEIEVFGVRLDAELREVFSGLGATEFSDTPDGFVCRRLVAAIGERSPQDDL